MPSYKLSGPETVMRIRYLVYLGYLMLETVQEPE